MSIVVHNNISSKLKNSTSEIDNYSYTKHAPLSTLPQKTATTPLL